MIQLQAAMNKSDWNSLQNTMNNLIKTLSPNEMKRHNFRQGTIIQKDIADNFAKDRTFDDEKMPDLKPSTIAIKKKANKTKKLFMFGTLQKTFINATHKGVMVFSRALYGVALNERSKDRYGNKLEPFKFAGWGKRLINATMKLWDKIMTEALTK